MTLFAKGLLFGFLLAATVGPMWVLCFRRTVAQGALAGFVSGMGIAVADGLYGAVAAFGLTAISGFLLRHSFWIGLIGALFLIYLGLKIFLARPVLEDHWRRGRRAGGAGRVSRLGVVVGDPRGERRLAARPHRAGP